VAAAATGIARPVGRMVRRVVAAVGVPVPGVVIAVWTPSDIAGPPDPAHPRRTPIPPPRPYPSEADVVVPRTVVVGQPSPGLVGNPRIAGGGPVPATGAIGLPATTDGRLPCPGVDRVDVDPAPVVVELGGLP
jgi:hypothetical protein